MNPPLFRSGRGALAFFLLVVPVALLFYLGFPALMTTGENPSNYTSTVQGTVTSTETHWVSSGHGGHDETTCDYSYSLGGSAYSGSDSCSSDDHKGERVTLHYDPRHPDDARLSSYGEWQNIAKYFIVALVATAVILMVAYPFYYRWKYAVGLRDAWLVMRARKRRAEVLAVLREQQDSEAAPASTPTDRPILYSAYERRDTVWSSDFAVEKTVLLAAFGVATALVVAMLWRYDAGGHYHQPAAAADPSPHRAAATHVPASTRPAPKPRKPVKIPPTPLATRIVHELEHTYRFKATGGVATGHEHGDLVVSHTLTGPVPGGRIRQVLLAAYGATPTTVVWKPHGEHTVSADQGDEHVKAVGLSAPGDPTSIVEIDSLIHRP